ncbi:MAG: LUD domain-containing protein [Proteobacteria bacterium]|nr:LUD domain-containing protein [Pseudomonadota bacterium]MBU4384065.1 LUD domain-containing protein [Pseudomonadota bacterium]MBU4603967.1 LUD domain-containing protein [Pseudomonadota bacterium]MCG2763704.1 LUD domain-containing protein [Desulfarculaceae bacterium]
MSRASRRQYHQRLKGALDNTFLGQTLARFQGNYRGSRQAGFAGMDFEALAAEVGAAKDAALGQLEALYQQFKAQAEAAGATVHLAHDAAHAREIIADIAAQTGSRRIIKSKSMTSEEIHLNRHLEAQGLKVTETDLGEWIIQLRGEGPSHMVAPAIHLSRSQVAELFTQVTGEKQDPEDIASLVEVARQRLRQTMLEADMGISGANFALASTGSIATVTNEGNARLVTTLPKVHVALVGLEKLVPDLHTALKILQLLPRSATGQLISTYVTWVTGAVECAANGGKKELHIVFLDNGRLALSQDPVFSQALRCLRCGSCANVCPIFGKVGGHNYGHVYIGAIGLILTYFYHGREAAQELVGNCLNCQACKVNCPADIDLPALIKKTAGLVMAEQGRPLKNQLLRRVLTNRPLFHFLLRRAYLAQKPLAGGGRLIRHLPLFFAPDQEFRSLPVVAAEPLRDRWQRLAPKVSKPRLKVALFGGCLVDFVYPEQAEAFLGLIQGKDIQVDYARDQSCCGLPAAMASEEETAREVARQNLAALDAKQHDYVLTLCASCASHLKKYPALLADDPVWSQRARHLAAKVIDLASFLQKEVGLKPSAEQDKAVAYHAPCHLCRGLGVHEAPKELLREAGYDYRPYDDEEVCCGFGGSYSLDFPELSAAILERKLRQVAATGADTLVTDCPGCVLQLEGGLDHLGSPIKVRHLAQALAEAKDK